MRTELPGEINRVAVVMTETESILRYFATNSPRAEKELAQSGLDSLSAVRKKLDEIADELRQGDTTKRSLD
jgi:L-lysine 2,3-aminomutase